VEERHQHRIKKKFEEKGYRVSLWYECKGGEDVVIVPPHFLGRDGFLIGFESGKKCGRD
jgi:hypothetical protein